MLDTVHVFQIAPIMGIVICPPNTKAEQECQATELSSRGTRNQKFKSGRMKSVGDGV